MLVVKEIPARPGPQLTRSRPRSQPDAPRRHTIFLVLCLAFAAALPATAQTSQRHPSPSRRRASCSRTPRAIARSTRSANLGVTNVRQLILLARLRPAPEVRNRKPRGRFVASDPATYPADTWAPLDTLIRDASARGIKVHLNLTGPGPRWATKIQKDNVTRPIPEGVPGLGDGRRRPLRRGADRDVVDLERAQPAAVPDAPVPQREALLARALPAALPGPACAG